MYNYCWKQNTYLSTLKLLCLTLLWCYKRSCHSQNVIAQYLHYSLNNYVIIKSLYGLVCTLSGLYDLGQYATTLRNTKRCTCAHCNITHKCKLVHTHAHSGTMWQFFMDINALAHTHVHTPKLWHPHKFTHVLIRSPAFHSFQQPSPTVPSVSRFPSRVFVFPDY